MITTTTSNKVYVCYLTTGRYSDTSFQVVNVFRDEQKAKALKDEVDKVYEILEGRRRTLEQVPTTMTKVERDTFYKTTWQEHNHLLGELVRKYHWPKLGYEGLDIEYKEFEVE